MSLLILFQSAPVTTSGSGLVYYQQLWENDMQLLRQGTASQEVLLGPFVSSTDFKTAQTGLTIAGSDIRLWKSGAVAEVAASGGGTHIAGGRYYASLSATDTDTPGMLEINVEMSGCLPVKSKYYILSQSVYDSLFSSGSTGPLKPTVDGRSLDVTATGAAGIDWGNVENQSAMVALGNTNIQLCADVDNVGFVNVLNAGAITASSIAANALDNKGNWNIGKSGYALTPTTGLGNQTANITGNLSGSVNSVTSAVTVGTINSNTITAASIAASALNGKGDWNIGKTGYALTQAFPANFASLGINVSGHISRVTLVDTTTTNTDMRGTDNAALASNWTATRAGYLDGVLLAANFAQRTVQVTGSNHVAADIHELQPYVITDLDFDATGLAAIAGRVADEPLATHTTAGTLGKVLSDAGSGVTTLLGRITSSVATMFSDLITMITGSGVSPKWSANALSLAPTSTGGGTGTGARTVTITTQLSGAPLEGASVRLTKGAETYVGQTNVSGQLTFNVDDGTWVVSITSPGATFGGASLVVDGPETMTYSLTAISVTPSAPGGVTGYWLCLGVNGLIESGVTMSMQAVEVPEGSTGLALDTTIRTATSNGSGVAQFTDLVPGARYSAWRGTGSKRYITIPEDASGSLELNSLLGSP